MSRRSSISAVGPSPRRLAGVAGEPGEPHDPDFADALERARQQRRQVLVGRSNADIIAAIAQTASDWLDDRGAILTRTAAELEPALGLAAGMLARGLGYTFEALRRDALERLVAEQAENPRALERAVSSSSGRPRRLLGPEAVLHMLAGNVPGLAVPAVAVSLLARSVIVVRDSARQPLFTARFVESLAARAPDLAAMVVPVTWTSEDGKVPAALARSVDRVELYGADDTIARLSGAFERADVVRRGTRVSTALVTGDCDVSSGGGAAAAAARNVAMDVVMYDGLGCLSPSVVIVEGTTDRAERFAVTLGGALQELERRWPRHRRDVRTEASRRAFLEAAEAAEITGRGRLITGPGATCATSTTSASPAAWAVRFDPDRAIEFGPGARCVTVISARDRAATLARLCAAASPLAAVGVASPGAEPTSDLVEQLEGAGAAIVCAAGRMQAPPIDRDPDGGRRLADLLRWREVGA